jgi:CubicO group peptidase (beta-lactamase class C family)
MHLYRLFQEMNAGDNAAMEWRRNMSEAQHASSTWQPRRGCTAHPQSADGAPQRFDWTREYMRSAMSEPYGTATSRQKERTMTHEIVMTPKRTGMAAAQDVRKLLQHRGRSVVVLALAALVALLGVLARPSPPSLSTLVTGDAVLAARAQPLLAGALDHVSIAVVDGSTTTYAGFGADEHTEYEIGSLTKTFTALLLADAIRRGEVTADTNVGALLPLGDAPLADVTLAELASHRSGLSAQGMQPRDAFPFMLRLLSHRNPFIHDVDGVLAIARRATLTGRGSVVYSNLGVAVLGHALAAAAQMDYTQLVQERLFTPLRMDTSSLPLTGESLPSGAPTGYSATGVPEAPWTINGWAPAGGVRSTTADMVRYAQALLEGTAPGMEALTPRWEVGAQQIGYVWTTQDYEGHTVTMKNGLTGGFTSKIILDRAKQRAVIVLSNTAAEVDTVARRLLVGEQAWIASR